MHVLVGDGGGSIANQCFDQFQAQTGATAQMLAARLKRLIAAGFVKRRAYSWRPSRHEYLLTDMGREFFPVVLALRAWGEKWCKTGTEPLAVRMTHRKCGAEVGLDGMCPTCCLVVPPAEMDSQLGSEYTEERRRRQEAYRE